MGEKFHENFVFTTADRRGEYFKCEQVLFVYVYSNPTQFIRSMQFHYW